MQQTLDLPNPESWLTPTQAVRLLQVSRATLYQMLADGRITRHKVGATTLIWRAEALEVAAAVQRTRKPADA